MIVRRGIPSSRRTCNVGHDEIGGINGGEFSVVEEGEWGEGSIGCSSARDDCNCFHSFLHSPCPAVEEISILTYLFSFFLLSFSSFFWA